MTGLPSSLYAGQFPVVEKKIPFQLYTKIKYSSLLIQGT